MRSSITRLSDQGLRHYMANTERLLRLEEMGFEEPVRGTEALVFTGEHDSFTPPAACREIAEAFERGWFTTIRRADHLFHLERFDVVVKLLSRFMGGALGEPIEGCSPLIRIGAGRIESAA
jgi:pimeloyl-ACP methyl ester carboxylesterase